MGFKGRNRPQQQSRRHGHCLLACPQGQLHHQQRFVRPQAFRLLGYEVELLHKVFGHDQQPDFGAQVYICRLRDRFSDTPQLCRQFFRNERLILFNEVILNGRKHIKRNTPLFHRLGDELRI
jgi:hypothetical protein